MTNAQTQTLPISTLVSSCLGFALGIISAWVVEFIKRRQEKQRLINLFMAELRRTHLEIDSRKEAPVGKIWGRGRFALLGISGLQFSGIPEYELEVFNTKLYETEGVRLAQQLRPKGRRCFWTAYGHLRDAEAIRLVLKRLNAGDQDYTQYQTLFVELIKRSSGALDELWRALEVERSILETIREAHW